MEPRDPEAEQDLRTRVDALSWWHRIDLGHGLVTPGSDDSPAKLARLHLPSDLSGRRVLDIGAWDGFFSFEAERRGADVTAMDWLAWQRGESSGRPCFEIARGALGSKVADLMLDVMELDGETAGEFDLVLCLGVLYHLRDPLGALERVASVTQGQLVLETHTDALGERRPSMVLYPGSELNDDASNWWGPNEAALCAMLRDVGFARAEVVWRRSRRERLARALKLGWPGGTAQIRDLYAQGRVVVHAFK